MSDPGRWRRLGKDSGCAAAARVLEGDASRDGERGRKGVEGELARGALYLVVAAAGRCVAERWASTSLGCDRAAGRRGGGRL